MGNEIFKPDANFKAGGVVGGYSSSDAAEATSPTKFALRINPTTLRLLVDVNGATTVTDGEAVDGDDTGTLVLGTDGSNYQILSTDSDGHVQVDVLSGGGGGVQYATNIAYADGNTGTMALAVRDDALTTLTPADGDFVPVRTNSVGALWSQIYKVGSVIDSGNTSTTPLGIDGVFTGTGVDLLGYTNITVQIASDVDSSATGISLEFSPDNSNWDETHTHFFDFSNESSRKFQLPVHARYFRVVYTNGGAEQAYFRLQTILHTGTPITTIHRLDEDLAPDRSAQVVKSILMAQAAGSGNFTPIDSTAGGNLKVSIQEISDGLDIGAGNADSETQRVSISTDDVNLSGILADTAIMSEWDNIASDGASVSGDVAHDGVDAGEPVKIGGKAQTHLAAPDEVADNDRVNALLDRVGRQAVYQGYQLKSAAINDDTSGDNEIVAAVATKRIRVLAVAIVSDGTTDVRWESGAGGTALTGQIPLQAREGYTISNPWGLFETAAVNTALSLELTANILVHGWVTYIEVDD